MNVKAEFIQDDIRNIDFIDMFDVVLNLADGAIGYLDNEEENFKIFDIVSKAVENILWTYAMSKTPLPVSQRDIGK